MVYSNEGSIEVTRARIGGDLPGNSQRVRSRARVRTRPGASGEPDRCSTPSRVASRLLSRSSAHGGRSSRSEPLADQIRKRFRGRKHIRHPSVEGGVHPPRVRGRVSRYARWSRRSRGGPRGGYRSARSLALLGRWCARRLDAYRRWVGRFLRPKAAPLSDRDVGGWLWWPGRALVVVRHRPHLPPWRWRGLYGCSHRRSGATRWRCSERAQRVRTSRGTQIGRAHV